MRIKERLQILNDIIDAAELFGMELIDYNIEDVYAVFESSQTREFYGAEVTRETIIVGSCECADTATAIRTLHQQLIKDKMLIAKTKKNIDAVSFYKTVLRIMGEF